MAYGKKNPCFKPVRCPICGMIVLCWKRGTLSASLVKALAMADHVKTAHPERSRDILVSE